ncbi:hypothetical protein, partial [Escherichia coli]|uniref:hypothetical protein n=1 Tax=Escherichia coli TaxID=562 RepID=UPI0013D37851
LDSVGQVPVAISSHLELDADDANTPSANLDTVGPDRVRLDSATVDLGRVRATKPGGKPRRARNRDVGRGQHARV